MSTTRSLIESLPTEIIYAIEEQLSCTDKARVAKTNKYFYQFGIDNNEHSSFFKKNSRIIASNIKINQLLACIISGEKKQAEELIQNEPGLLLEKGKIRDLSGRRIEGTPLQVALSVQDFSFDYTCRQLIIRDVDLKWKIKSPFINSYSAYVRYFDKLFYTDQVNEQSVEIYLGDEQLKQFDNSVPSSGESHKLSNKEKGLITKILGRSYHSEEMYEMIKFYLNTLPNGRKHVREQVIEQFPKGWKIAETERIKRNRYIIHNVLGAIKASLEGDNGEFILDAFRKYLYQENEKVFKCGKIFDLNILAEANELYFESKYYIASEHLDDESKRKKNIFKKVIATILQYVPACTAQVLLQGPSSILNSGEPLKRSLSYNFYDGNTRLFKLPKDIVSFKNNKLDENISRFPYPYNISNNTNIFNVYDWR